MRTVANNGRISGFGALAGAIAVAIVIGLRAAPAVGAPRVEAAALAGAVARMVAAKPGAPPLDALLTAAALRDDIGAAPMLAALRPVLRRHGQATTRLGLAALTLRALVRDLVVRVGDPRDRAWRTLPGEVASWSWLGPMPADAGTAFARESADESSVTRAARYAGRDGPATWQPVPAELLPNPQLGELIQRATDAIVFAEAWLHVTQATDVVVALVAGGRARLYLDGERVLVAEPAAAGHVVTAALPCPQLARVRLDPGWHALRVKLADPAGRFALSVAMQRADGKPLAARWTIGPPEDAKAATSRRGPQQNALDKLVAAAHKGTASAVAAIALAAQHGWPLPPDASAVMHKQRAKVSAAALAWASSPAAPGDRVSRVDQLVERGMRGDDGLAVGLLTTATTALLDLERAPDAHKRWLSTAERLRWRPEQRSARACASRVDLWVRLGADFAAYTQARACRAQWPQSLATLQVCGRLARARDDIALADEVQRAIVRLAPADPRELLDRIGLLTQNGTIDAATGQLADRIATLGVPHRRVHEILARAHVAAGRPAAALSALARLPRWQWRATTWELSSRAAARLGDRKRAIEDLRAALRSAPGRDDYRARLRLLVPDDLFFRPYRQDLLAAAGKLPVPSSALVTAFAQTVIRHDGARQARYEAQLIAVGDGAPDAYEVTVDYVPSQSTVEVLQAAVHKRDGRVVRRVKRSLQSLSESWYGLYYDLESMTLRFTGLERGDVLIVEHVVRDFAADPFGLVFGEQLLLGDDRPVLQTDVTIELPTGTALRHSTWDPKRARPLATGLAKAGSRADKGRQYDVWRLHVGHLPATPVDSSMPGATEVVPYLQVSSFASWAAAATWYAGLVEQALAGAGRDPGIKALARDLNARADTPAGKVAEVFRYVADEIRYVGLEFGIHGLKPHDASQVLSRRFGDCKDKATLIVALLTEMGIPAQVALVRTGSNGKVADGVASLGVFDHAIVWIPGLNWWLDATQQHHAVSELPELDVGGMALRIPRRGDAPADKPVPLAHATAAQNHRDGSTDVELAADGSARTRSRLTLRGLPAAEARKRLHDEATRVERIQQDIHKRWPGAAVSEVRTDGVAPVRTPVELAYTAAVPKYAEVQAGELVMRPFQPGSPLADRLATAGERAQDLLLSRAFSEVVRLRVRPPKGWELVTPGAPIVFKSAHASLKLSVAAEPGGAVARMALTIADQRIAATDHEAWRTALRTIDGHLATAVRFARVGAPK